MMQPMLVDISNVLMQYQEELSEMQSDESLKSLFNIKAVMAWHCDETESKYPHSTIFARKLLLPFTSSYLADCEISAVNDLLLKKRNRLDITKRYFSFKYFVFIPFSSLLYVLKLYLFNSVCFSFFPFTNAMFI